MTRRERHIRILKNFGRVGQYSRNRVQARLGWDAFTDEAIEQMTAATVADWRADQKRNAKNRAIQAAQLGAS